MMISDALYTDEIWKIFEEKVAKASKPKTYSHFDHVFDFAAHGERIKSIVGDPTLSRVASHSFTPHVKILAKTPRYKFDDSIDEYDLETKIRPISFASHFDSYIYSFYATALTEAYQKYIRDKRFDPCILAYRSDLNGDCNIQFAKRAFDSVGNMVEKHGRCTAIALDITGYFDNIDHGLLKEQWCKIIDKPALPIDQYKVYRSLTNYRYVGKASFLKHFKVELKMADDWYNLMDLIPNDIAGASFQQKFELIRERQLIVKNKPKENPDGTISFRGIPQGSPMSSVLSNIYLIDFDKWLYNLGRHMGFIYYRYCDDLLLICKSEDADHLSSEIVKEINDKYKLTIQEKKTELIEFRENSKGKIRAFNVKGKGRSTTAATEQHYYKNLQYLGFEFNGKNTYIRPGSLSRYFRKAKGRVTKTMMMAYGKRSKASNINKKQLYFKYSHFGERNFITYAQNAAKKQYTNKAGVVRDGLDSVSIKRQLSAHFSLLERDMIKTSNDFAKQKGVKVKR